MSNSVDAIKPESIKKAFRCCGIASQGEEVPVEDMNTRMQAVIAAGEKQKGKGNDG